MTNAQMIARVRDRYAKMPERWVAKEVAGGS